MSMIRATTTRLVALRPVNPSHICAGVANAAFRGLGKKREIGEGMDEEKMRPGERSQVKAALPLRGCVHACPLLC